MWSISRGFLNKQIQKALKVILKEEEDEDYTLNPEIKSNEVSPVERDEPRPAQQRAKYAEMEKL